MAQAKDGDTAKVHYTGKLADGTVFDSSRESAPLEFTVGGGHIIKGFDEAVVDMAVGETKTLTISAENAYGPHRQEMVIEVDRSKIPEGVDAEVGKELQTKSADGEPILVRVIAVDDSKVTLDANHPLAGEDLTFEIELAEIA